MAATETSDADNTGPAGLASGERNPAIRTLDLLIWMAGETPPWSVRSASRTLGTSPASVHRLLSALEARELVRRDENGRYFPGHELIRVAHAFSRKVSIKQIARARLEQIATETTEAALLSQFDVARPAMMFVDIILAAHPITYITQTYEWKPLHAGASGLSILAALSPGELTRYFDVAHLDQLTERTMVTQATVRKEIDLIKDRGYAITKGQRTVGAVGIAVPYFDAQDRVAGSLCLTIPEQRFDPAMEAAFAKLLLEGAAGISRDLRASGLSGQSGLYEDVIERSVR